MGKFVILENVADERGESSAKVARTLVRLGCDLYLHLDESKGLRTCEVQYEVLGEGWSETNIVTPGYFPLLPESTTEAIKRISNNNFSIEGLIFVNKFEDGKTFKLKFIKDDSSVSIVAKNSDVHLLPPPSKYQTAPASMSPTQPEKNNFQNSENNYHKNRKSNPEIHKIFWRAFNFLLEKYNREPEYKEVWQVIFDDVENSDIKDSLAERREFDPSEIIEKIDPIGMTNTTKLFWLVATAGGEISSQGYYSLSSLPSLINKLKKNPPKI